MVLSSGVGKFINDFSDSYTGYNREIHITGLVFNDTITDSVDGGTEKVLVSLTGPGMVYSGFIFFNAYTHSARDCEIFFSFDGNPRKYYKIGFLFDNGLLAGLTNSIGLCLYDEVNYVYGIFINEKLTFEKSFELGVVIDPGFEFPVDVRVDIGYTKFD